jgi:hypothetical protein
MVDAGGLRGRQPLLRPDRQDRLQHYGYPTGNYTLVATQIIPGFEIPVTVKANEAAKLPRTKEK